MLNFLFSWLSFFSLLASCLFFYFFFPLLFSLMLFRFFYVESFVIYSSDFAFYDLSLSVFVNFFFSLFAFHCISILTVASDPKRSVDLSRNEQLMWSNATEVRIGTPPAVSHTGIKMFVNRVVLNNSNAHSLGSGSFKLHWRMWHLICIFQLLPNLMWGLGPIGWSFSSLLLWSIV